MAGELDDGPAQPRDRDSCIDWILQRIDNAKPPVAPVVTAMSTPGDRVSHKAGVTAKPRSAPSPVVSLGNQSRQSSRLGGRQPQEMVANEAGEDASRGSHRRCADFPLTDLGNAERFAARFKGKLVWCAALGWLVWDGRRYAAESAEERVRKFEHQTVRFIQDEARALEEEAHRLAPDEPTDGDGPAPVPGDPAERKPKLLARAKQLRAWGRKSEANKAIAVIARNARPYLAVNVGSLNADPMKLNVLNGTLVFDKALPGYVELRPHDPADLITRMAPVAYDPEATCPLYDAFLARVQPETAMRAFLHRWMGYSLTADAGEQKFVVFYGTGRNGKGTFVELCCAIAGDYAEYVPIETFLHGNWQLSGAQARPDLMLLHNVRMVRSVEPDEGVRFNEALIKQITGGDPVQARDLNRPMVRFRPHLKLTISANHRPAVRGGDEGIWSRIKLVPWEQFIPDEERDRGLSAKLWSEASGVLNRLLDGLRQWFDTGLAFPETVERATAEYREDSDVLGQFLGDCTVAEQSARVQSSHLHRVLVAWQKMRGDRPWSNKAMSNALLARGLRKKKSNGEWWLGIRLTRSEAEFVDLDGRPRAPRSDIDPPSGDDEVGF